MKFGSKTVNTLCPRINSLNNHTFFFRQCALSDRFHRVKVIHEFHNPRAWISGNSQGKVSLEARPKGIGIGKSTPEQLPKGIVTGKSTHGADTNGNFQRKVNLRGNEQKNCSCYCQLRVSS